MHRINVKFSLIALGLCLGFACAANAAPSVRVLGSNTAKTSAAGKATAIKKGQNIKPSAMNANTGAKKAASVKKLPSSTSVLTPVGKPVTNRIDTPTTKPAETEATTGAAAAETQRFPGIATKSNIQFGNRIVTDNVSTTGKTGYNIQDINDRLSTAEGTLSDKADKTDLDAYYTKEQINSNYYTKDEIQDIIEYDHSITSSEYINHLDNRVTANSNSIDSIANKLDNLSTSVFDNTTAEDVDVYFVDTFSESVLGAE